MPDDPAGPPRPARESGARNFLIVLITILLRSYTDPVSQPSQDRNIGDVHRLRALREAAGLTLLELSADIGYSVTHLSNVERGRRRPGTDLARRYEALTVETGNARAQRGIALGPAAAWCGSWDEDDFGTRQMRLRIANGWSLALLAAKTKVSKSYLGNIEVGRRTPSPAVARACDRAFGADGGLARLREKTPEPAAPPPGPGDPAPGAAELAPWSGQDPDELLARAHAALLELRGAAQRDRPRHVLADLAGNARTLASAAAGMQGPRGRELWLLAARYAEFTGWMVQEAGRDDLAQAWTDTAAQWAASAGDHDMSSYLWERCALAALYRGDARGTVELARRGASERSASPRVLGLAVRRQAQGHALAGDRAACRSALDRAAELLSRGPAPYPAGASWGPNSISDTSVFVEAFCLVDLGLHRKAADLFGTGPGIAVPSNVARTRHRFAVREAMAVAGAGEIDRACALVTDLLPGTARIDSATLRADLSRLLAALGRHRRHPRAQALLPDLYNLTRTG